MLQSTVESKPGKIAKPRPDFPLFPHATGRWAKKVRGRFVYFGKVSDDPKGEAALDKWLDEKDDLLAGRTPRGIKPDGLTIREMADRFMVSRRNKLACGELAPVTFGDYYATCRRIIDAFGATRLVSDLDANDFQRFRAAMAKNWSPVTLGNEIQRVRVVFRFAEQNNLIDVPIRYGTEFKKPPKKVLRTCRKKNGARMFEAEQLRAIIDAASTPLKAMVLLGINCGYGNSDIMSLPIKAIDLEAGLADYMRQKTGIDRRCPLWPETIAAIKEAITERHMPREACNASLVFITKHGRPWGSRTITESKEEGEKLAKNMDDPVCKEFNKLLKRLQCLACGRLQTDSNVKECEACKWKPSGEQTWGKIHRNGLGFYALRHTFETIGGDNRDQVAVDAIMGHARDDMASVYRERIDDSRLKAVTDHIRKWLWPASVVTRASTLPVVASV